MVRTVITPNTQIVSFAIPPNYGGKEIEVIAFAKDEGTSEAPSAKKLSFRLYQLTQGALNSTETRLMSDKAFLDSNILVYTYSSTEKEKQEIARRLVIENNTFISTQVLQEVCNIITRKFKLNHPVAIAAVKECCSNNNVHVNTESTIIQTCMIAERYQYTFYDSLILSAAIECDCSILYSEDLSDGQVISDKITIKSPCT